MKRVIIAACSGAVVAATTLSGCATGAPVGARSPAATLAAGYRPFTRAAAPRSIPSGPATVDAAQDAAVASAARPLTAEDRGRAVELASGLVGQRHVKLGGKQYRDDCTGLVMGVFDQLGVRVLADAAPGDNAVTAIYRYAEKHGRIFDGGRPLPGDLVFFRETYDLNGDGRINDGLTHIGLVEDVDADGTVTVIHRVQRGVVRYRMNLANPDVRRDPVSGRVLNDYLRNAGAGQHELLTAQLFAAYATILPTSSNVAAR